MPYFLKQVGKKYFVVDTSGKQYSKKPLPKARAERQLKALHINTGHGLYGGDLMQTLGEIAKQGYEAFRDFLFKNPELVMSMFGVVALTVQQIRQLFNFAKQKGDGLELIGGLRPFGQFNTFVQWLNYIFQESLNTPLSERAKKFRSFVEKFDFPEPPQDGNVYFIIYSRVGKYLSLVKKPEAEIKTWYEYYTNPANSEYWGFPIISVDYDAFKRDDESTRGQWKSRKSGEPLYFTRFTTPLTNPPSDFAGSPASSPKATSGSGRYSEPDTHILIGDYLKGSGTGKWTALINALARMYNIPKVLVDSTIALNDRKTGPQRFNAKKQNILSQFSDYLNPTVVSEIRDLDESDPNSVSDYANTIDGRIDLGLSLRSVNTVNPLQVSVATTNPLSGQGKIKFVKKYLRGQGLPATKKNVEKICNIMDVEGVVFE